MADEIYLPRIPDGRFDAIVASARAAGIQDIPDASRWRDLVLLWQSEYVGPNIRWVDVEEVPFSSYLAGNGASGFVDALTAFAARKD